MPPSEKQVDDMAILERNLDTIRSVLNEIEHHTSDLDGQVFTVQSSKGATTRAAIILRESNSIREALGKIWGNAAWYEQPDAQEPEATEVEKIRNALKLAREWIIEFAPTKHDDRCQRLREGGATGCRCTFDIFQEEMKTINKAVFASAPEAGEIP